MTHWHHSGSATKGIQTSNFHFPFRVPANARFPPFRCRSSVAVSPFPLAVAVSVYRCRCRMPWLVGVDDWLVSYGTEQRKKQNSILFYYGKTAKRQRKNGNGMVETGHQKFFTGHSSHHSFFSCTSRVKCVVGHTNTQQWREAVMQHVHSYNSKVHVCDSIPIQRYKPTTNVECFKELPAVQCISICQTCSSLFRYGDSERLCD